MRYQIGQVIPALCIVFSARAEKGPHGFSPYYPWWPESGIKEVRFFELAVAEHYKVSSEYDEEDKKDCDGYILKDAEGAYWTNQYPRAYYGQISSESDSRFTRKIEDDEASVWFDSNKDAVYETKSFASYLSDLKYGLHTRKQEQFQAQVRGGPEEQALQEKYTKLLEDHLAAVVDKYETTFGKKVVFTPITFKSRNDANQRTLPGHFRVTFEPKCTF